MKLRHDEWCECSDCYGKPMAGLAIICAVMTVLLAGLFRLVG